MNEQALETALEAGRNAYWDKGGPHSGSRSVSETIVRAAIEAYLAALPEEKPVWWMYEYEFGGQVILRERKKMSKGFTETPLYTHAAR